MKTGVKIYLFLGCAIFGLGSTMNCYSCVDSSDKICEKNESCGPDNSCLVLTASGFAYRRCLLSSLCDFEKLSAQPPFNAFSQFTFKCCTSNLCNSASSTATTPVIGLLTALVLIWWNIH